jgi:putative phosphoesterase
MKLAILSDIHDNVWNLRRALRACRDASVLLCCGDLCSPFIVNILAREFLGPIHIVFGNNDGDQTRITQNAARFGHRIQIHGEFATLSPAQAGIRVAMNHYPRLAKGLAVSGDFDLVCYGHDHALMVDLRRDGCSLINPGAVMGYDPIADEDIISTCVVLETSTMCGYILGVGSDQLLPMWPIDTEHSLSLSDLSK